MAAIVHAQEIDIEQPSATPLTSGDSRDFGTQEIGGSVNLGFVIRNTGAASLTLSPAPSFGGIHAADFSLSGFPTSSMAPGTSDTFSIRFNPSSPGARTASLKIFSNDANESSYTINLTGTGVTPVPDIKVEQNNGNDIPDGGSRGFGSVTTGQSNSRVFVLKNVAATADLDFTALPLISGPDAAAFSLQAFSTSSIPAGLDRQFTVDFAPVTLGAKTATLQFFTNDPDENPFDIALSGTANGPEIDVESPVGTNLTSGISTIDFGSSSIQVATSLTFVVYNNGNQDTAVSTTIATGDTSSFSDDFPASVVVRVGIPRTFQVSFTPDSEGPKTSRLRISSNDGDEDPFEVILTGIGVPPEIAVEQPATTDLPNGGSRDFGSVDVSSGATNALAFLIRNTGAGDLVFSAAPQLLGTDADSFSLGPFSTAPIASGDSRTLSVTFAPTEAGSHSATLRIASTDPDESPFDVSLQGTGAGAEIVVEQPEGANLVDDASTVSFGSESIGLATELDFTIRNIGTTDLDFPSAPLIVGAHSNDFAVTAFAGGPVAPGGSVVLTVSFSPLATAQRDGELRIFSNDASESPFNIALTGIGREAEIAVSETLEGDLTEGDGQDYGTVVVGANSNRTFTIQNLGNGDLGGLVLTLSGTDAADFELLGNPADSVAPLGETSFGVRFAPHSPGSKSALLQIASNDQDEDPFDILLSGNATAVLSATYLTGAEVPVRSSGLDASGLTAELTLGYAPDFGTSLRLVENTGIGFIQGGISNLPNGSTVELTYNGLSYPFIVWYYGGDGNDLVLLWPENHVAGWGNNGNGKLGDNTTVNRLAPEGG